MQTRRGFIASILSLIGGSAVAQPRATQRKWYITGGYHEVDGKPVLIDCSVPPIICYGSDRLNALANSGITVWSQEEWEKFEPEFRKSCKESGGK